jgi:hypothetical protein
MENNKLHSTGSKIILWLLVLTMLFFTASRTLDFLAKTLPADQAYIAYIGLAAFDIGVLGWLYYATNAAEGAAQRTVAYGMIFVCAAGVILTMAADMQMYSTANGLTKSDPNMATIAFYTVVVVIALNFLAGVLVHLNDPKHKRHMAVENGKDRIFAATVQAIEERAGEIAPSIAAALAAHWENQILVELTGSIPLKSGQTVPSLPPRSIPQLPEPTPTPTPTPTPEQPTNQPTTPTPTPTPEPTSTPTPTPEPTVESEPTLKELAGAALKKVTKPRGRPKTKK